MRKPDKSHTQGEPHRAALPPAPVCAGREKAGHETGANTVGLACLKLEEVREVARVCSVL